MLTRRALLTTTLALPLLLLPSRVPAQVLPWRPDMRQPLNKGLVAWWRVLPELRGTTQVYDVSPYKHHGTVSTLGSLWQPTDRRGGLGHFDFGGSPTIDVAHASASALSFERTDAFTIAFWQKQFTGSTRGILGKGNATWASNATGLGYLVQVTGTNPQCTLIQADLNYIVAQTTYANLNDGVTWYHLVATHDGTGTFAGLQWYVNGVPQAMSNLGSTATLTQTILNTQAFHIGWQSYNYLLDDIRMWRRWLTPVDVVKLYEESQRGDPALLPRWPFEASRLAPPAGRGRFLPFFGR